MNNNTSLKSRIIILLSTLLGAIIFGFLSYWAGSTTKKTKYPAISVIYGSNSTTREMPHPESYVAHTSDVCAHIFAIANASLNTSDSKGKIDAATFNKEFELRKEKLTSSIEKAHIAGIEIKSALNSTAELMSAWDSIELLFSGAWHYRIYPGDSHYCNQDKLRELKGNPPEPVESVYTYRPEYGQKAEQALEIILSRYDTKTLQNLKETILQTTLPKDAGATIPYEISEILTSLQKLKDNLKIWKTARLIAEKRLRYEYNAALANKLNYETAVLIESIDSSLETLETLQDYIDYLTKYFANPADTSLRGIVVTLQSTIIDNAVCLYALNFRYSKQQAGKKIDIGFVIFLTLLGALAGGTISWSLIRV